MNDAPPRLPEWLLRAGGAAWRTLAIGAVVYFGFTVLREVSVIVLAVVLALFPVAVLWRPVRWLEEHGWRSMPATSVVMLVAGGGIGAILFLTIPSLADRIGELAGDVATAGKSIRSWLVTGPLELSETQIDDYWQSLVDRATAGGGISAGLLGGAGALAEVVTGFFVMAITTFFVLKDGPALADGLVWRLPPHRAEIMRRSMRVTLDTLSHYMRGLAIVGLVDGIVIGIALAIIGVPLVFALATLTFFGAFFPLVGAWVAGLASVAVAFVHGGITEALIVLAVITAVQQLEGDLVLPVVFGKALVLHPLVILLAVGIGGLAFGIPGAFLAVPILAVAIAIRQDLADDPDTTLTALAQGVDAATRPLPDEDETAAP